MTKEIFEELLHALVESHYVKIKTSWNSYLSLLTKGRSVSNSYESANETLTSNETLAINQ